MYQRQQQAVCPDGNHPHKIDLGLPSGIMWSCCNVGVNAPEKYENYYAWGETEANKDVYDLSTYSHYDETKGSYKKLGDFAGEDGRYWSSTRSPLRTYYAYYLYFDSSPIGYYGDRFYGFSVRPVSR